MTALEFIYAIREELKEYVDDTKFTNEFLLYQADMKRTMFIQQKYNNIQRPVNEQLIQTFLVDMLEQDISDSPTSAPLDETMMISTVRLPKIITLHHRNMLERVTTHGKLDRPFNIVSRKRFIYSGKGDYDVDQFFVTMDGDNNLLIKSNNDEDFTIEKLSVSAVLERPLDELNYETSNSLKTLDTFIYPISSEIAMLVITSLVQELSRVKALPNDQENNSNDDATIVNQGNGQQ
jgi:hypothetical protein